MHGETPTFTKPPWQGMALLGLGVILALGASFFAQRTGLGRSLALDLRGVRTIGTAEVMGVSTYHIRYQHPAGVIYRRHYAGRLSGEPLPDGELEIAVVFNPADPRQFQPAGLSYLPGVAALTAFAAGMAAVLKARTVVRAHYLKAGVSAPSKKEKNRRRLAPTLRRRKLLRLIMSVLAALMLLTLLYGCPQLNIPSFWDGNITAEH